ncbi:MAG: hypothetical protein ACI4PY_07110 [Akkermansia muciniphila]
MKRTLFNTMMGCLAALSLAGCGGSGSSSSGPSASSGPSESLISEGFEGVGIDAGVATSGGQSPSLVYALALYSSPQTYRLKLPNAEDKLKYDHEVTGTWSAKSLGNGEFELWLGDTSDKGCTISGRSVVLTIDDMEKYRAGKGSMATLSMAPFTHDKTDQCGYSCNTEGIQSAVIQQRNSLPQ